MEPAPRKRILLAELDDRLALQTFRRLFDHNQLFDVLIARTPMVSRALLESDQFSVVAVRTRVANPESLLRVTETLPKDTETRVVAVTEGKVAEGQAAEDEEALYALGADLVFGANTSATHLANALREASSLSSVLAGDLEQLAVPDLLQILCLCRRSLMLRVTAPESSGVIWLSEGEIHHAITDRLKGQDALNQLVMLADGHYAASTLQQTPARTIRRDWQHVLLEAARARDEAPRTAATSDSVPSEVRKVSGVHKSGLARYRELTELGLESVRSGNLTKAREYWKAARELSGEDDSVGADPGKVNSGVA